MTLTKAELADLLFEQLGLNKREAKDMVERFFEEIRDRARSRATASSCPGFGNFQLREKPQRPGRNPKTGEEIPITARRVVTFHASQKLKAMVEAANHARSTAELRLTLPADPRQALLHDRRGERAVRGQAARAALLGAGIHAAQAGQAPRQPPLLPAPRSAADPPHPRPALRAGLHHQRRAQPPRFRRRRAARGRARDAVPSTASRTPPSRRARSMSATLRSCELEEIRQLLTPGR